MGRGLVVDDFGHTVRLRGSPLADDFRYAHKTELGPGFYGADVDLLLVSKTVPHVVAALDVKRPGEPLSMAEVLAYDVLRRSMPVYVVHARDATTGPFTITEYLGGDISHSPPKVRMGAPERCESWAELGEWEARLRAKRQREVRGW